MAHEGVGMGGGRGEVQGVKSVALVFVAVACWSHSHRRARSAGHRSKFTVYVCAAVKLGLQEVVRGSASDVGLSSSWRRVKL